MDQVIGTVGGTKRFPIFPAAHYKKAKPSKCPSCVLKIIDQFTRSLKSFYEAPDCSKFCQPFYGKRYKAVAILIVSGIIVVLFYLLITEILLQFVLPLYALASTFYWYTQWCKRWSDLDECIILDSIRTILAIYTLSEFVIQFVIQFVGHSYGNTCILLTIQFIFWTLVDYSRPVGYIIFEWSLFVTFIGRLLAVRTLTVVPYSCRPFIAYCINYLALMASTLQPKRVSIMCPPNESTESQDQYNDVVDEERNVKGGPTCAGRGPPPCASNRLSSMTDQDLSKSFAAMSRKRRTSLPTSAGQFLATKTQDNLHEALGLINDLLSDRELPGHVISCLKVVSGLLNPQNSCFDSQTSSLDLPRFVENPFSGEQLLVAGKQTLVQDSPGRCVSVPEEIMRCASDGTCFNLTEIGLDVRLDQLKSWSFSIFDYSTNFKETLLTRIAYRIFRKSGLFRIFKIPMAKFFNFFHSLEKGYWDIPYHNRMHASDVMHGCYYLTALPLPAILSQLKENKDNSSDPGTENESKDGSLCSLMSSLELMALVVASAMHDYDHPGRTNAFLVAVKDQKAILYNDRSVLENYHAAAAWQLLTRTDNDFLEHLDPAEYKRFRYSVLELILATDLKQHFEVLLEFNSKINSPDGVDYSLEADRLLMNRMVIKIADINSPTKPYDLHVQWTNRILEEFYLQGDDERSRNLPVSPYMDRHKPQVAKLQDSFISHLVCPLVFAMADNGLLPLHATEDQNESELVNNIKNNQKIWKQELVKEEEEEESQEQDICTIQEEEDENGSTLYKI